MKPTSVAIIGWRGFSDMSVLEETMKEFVVTYGGLPQRVISGGAKGADTLAEQWARKHQIPILILKPKWRNAKGVYNPRAGLDRNTDIINEATHVVAFPSKKGRGTQDSIRKAKDAKKPCLVKWVE